MQLNIPKNRLLPLATMSLLWMMSLFALFGAIDSAETWRIMAASGGFAIFTGIVVALVWCK